MLIASKTFVRHPLGGDLMMWSLVTAGDPSFLCPPPQLLTLEAATTICWIKTGFRQVLCIVWREMCYRGGISDMYQSLQGDKRVPDPKRTQERLGESGSCFLYYRSLKALEGSRLQKIGWSVPHHWWNLPRNFLVPAASASKTCKLMLSPQVSQPDFCQLHPGDSIVPTRKKSGD